MRLLVSLARRLALLPHGGGLSMRSHFNCPVSTMGRFDSMIARMRKDAASFEKVRGLAESNYKDSTTALQALIDKVKKYQAKLDADAKLAGDYVRFIRSIEEGLPPWEKVLEKVKGMKETDDFKKYENQSGNCLAGKLDPAKPKKAQVIAKIENYLERELKRAEIIEANQKELIERWLKHQKKHFAAVEAVKRVNDSLGSD